MRKDNTVTINDEDTVADCEYELIARIEGNS
jgi:hypothetical protein